MLTFSLDQGAAHEAALGLIVLQSDESMEPELRTLHLGDGVALYHSRIPNADDVTPDTLEAMSNALPDAAALLPHRANLRAVAYGCTSGATVIGPARVASLIRAHHPNAACTDPMTAVIAACRALNIRRLGLLTPYIESVSAAMRHYISEQGIEIAAFASFEQKDDPTVARITEQSVLDALGQFSGQAVDGVFTSCTNLRSFRIIDAAEQQLGVPVLSSNLALGWHLMTLAGLDPQGAGPGSLFATNSAQ
ncbi:MAG: Asp/Glu racemase [Pseudomonadota bacterium]